MVSALIYHIDVAYQLARTWLVIKSVARLSKVLSNRSSGLLILADQQIQLDYTSAPSC